MSEDFVESVQPHMGYLRAHASKLARCTAGADDLVQDTLIRAWKGWRSFNDAPEKPRLRAWLHRIMYNTFVNTYRRQRRVQKRGVAVNIEGVEIAAPTPMDKGLSAEVEMALRWLGEEYRSVLELRAEGRSHKEISVLLDIPAGTSMSRYYRAREIMRELLEEP